MLVQIDLLDPTGLPVDGHDAAAKVLDPTVLGPHLQVESRATEP